jgi:hypothetical protein
MKMPIHRMAVRHGSAAVILAALVSVYALASSSSSKTSTAPAKPAAPARPAGGGAKPANGAKPGGNGAAGAPHGPSANGSGNHGPSANGAGSHGPSANSPTTHGPTTSTHGPTTTHGPGSGAAMTPGAHPASANGPISRPGAAGSTDHVTKSGSAERTRPNGTLSDVHDAKSGVDVHHGLAGGQKVSMERPDHSRVVSERGRPGFVQHPYSFHGRDFARRSYFYHGRAYDHFYHGYYYRGVYVDVYAPAFYYGPAFYGWAYNPWAVPIAYGWGWGAYPWYGFYGFYFTPYPVYPSAAFWLTDYIVSQDLAAAYAARQEAESEAAGDPPANGSPVLSADVKQLVADEVKSQLALENAESQQNAQKQDIDPASSGIARLVSDGRPHVFVSGGNLDVVDAAGKECVLSDGDVLQLQTDPPQDAKAADLLVLSSKGTPECAIKDTVSVTLSDLQEMQNHMRETIDKGLQDLQAKQGKGGLPSAPASAQGQPPAPAEYAAAAPPADPAAAGEIQQVAQQGDQAEKEVTAEVAQESGAPAPPVAAPAAQPVTIALGQSVAEVKNALGTPTRVANLGTKVIYYYNGMKVTFKEGKVSDVE